MYTQSQLMDLLAATVGLPESARTDDPQATLEQLGLDSLAYLQVQAEVSRRFGVRLDDEAPCSEMTAGEIVRAVSAAVRTPSVSA